MDQKSTLEFIFSKTRKKNVKIKFKKKKHQTFEIKTVEYI